MVKPARVIAAVVITVNVAVGGAVVVGTANAAADPLAKFHAQRAAFAPCPPPPPAVPPPGWPDDRPPPEPFDDRKGLECADVSVPLDYRNPAGETLTVAVTRKKATDPAKRRGVLMLVAGGPGGQGVSYPGDAAHAGLLAGYDLIGLDPRGVGYSTALVCEFVSPDYKYTRPTDAQIAEVIAGARERERGCERAGGGKRQFFTTANSARDMDVVRAALGERKLNLMGKSYGTYVTAVYGTLFPGNLDRSVLDSAINPDWVWREQWKQQALAQNRSVDAWLGWVAERDRAYGLGTSARAVRATVEALSARLATTPLTVPDEVGGEWGGSWFDQNGFDNQLGLVTDRTLWDVFARIVRSLRDTPAAEQPPTDTLRALAVLAAEADEDVPLRGGVWPAVNCEADWPTDLRVYEADMRRFRTEFPYGWGASAVAPHECTFRSFTPVEKPVRVARRGYPTGLVLQTGADPATPAAGGRAMADRLGDRLLTVPDDGTHVVYGQNACVTAATDAYLLDGVLPAPGRTCAGQPRPAVPTDGRSADGYPAPGPLADQVTKRRD